MYIHPYIVKIQRLVQWYDHMSNFLLEVQKGVGQSAYHFFFLYHISSGFFVVFLFYFFFVCI